MQDLRREIGKIAYSLDFYANQIGKHSRDPQKVSRIFREHACRLRESKTPGELIVLESTVAHEVEALEESACLLTLAGAAQD